MANIRWNKAVCVLAVAVLLSACSSERIRINTDTSVFNQGFSKPASPLQTEVVEQHDSFSLAEFARTGNQPEEAKNQDDLVLVKSVASRFKKSEAFIATVVSAATKYAYPDFPKRDDILAIIAVESTYNTKAHHRGSWGLMQIEARSHRKKYEGLDITAVDTNVRIGSGILREYYLLANRNKSGAIIAYNVGIGAYLKGKRNPPYGSKVLKEQLWLSSIK
ncbi:Transglycosylase SLT domain protein [compost metagenome]